MVDSGPLTHKLIVRYITLQTASLVVCWIWFAGLCSVAFFRYSWGDVEMWVLLIAGWASLFGLRPNLERAIDASYLKGLRTPQAMSERAAQLRPIKRRIDLLFSVSVMCLVVLGSLLWVGIVLLTAGAGGGQ